MLQWASWPFLAGNPFGQAVGLGNTKRKDFALTFGCFESTIRERIKNRLVALVGLNQGSIK